MNDQYVHPHSLNRLICEGASAGRFPALTYFRSSWLSCHETRFRAVQARLWFAVHPTMILSFCGPIPPPEWQDYRCVPSQYTVLKVDSHCGCDQRSLSWAPPSTEPGLCPWFDFCASLGCSPCRQLCLPTLSLSPHYVGNDNLLFHINFRAGLETTPVLQRFVSGWNSFIDSGGRTDIFIFWVSLPIIWFYLLSLTKFYNFSIKLLNVLCVYAVGLLCTFFLLWVKWCFVFPVHYGCQVEKGSTVLFLR